MKPLSIGVLQGLCKGPSSKASLSKGPSSETPLAKGFCKTPRASAKALGAL